MPLINRLLHWWRAWKRPYSYAATTERGQARARSSDPREGLGRDECQPGGNPCKTGHRSAQPGGGRALRKSQLCPSLRPRAPVHGQPSQGMVVLSALVRQGAWLRLRRQLEAGGEKLAGHSVASCRRRRWRRRFIAASAGRARRAARGACSGGGGDRPPRSGCASICASPTSDFAPARFMRDPLHASSGDCPVCPPAPRTLSRVGHG